MSRRAELQETLWRSDPHTALKHLIYRHYVNCWMGKILQKFPQATIVDAFAGPGAYVDGPDGSPVIFAKAYLEHSHMSRFRNLSIITAEVRPDRCDELSRRFAVLGTDKRLRIAPPLVGKFLDRFPDLLSAAHPNGSEAPVLWIVDPFAKEPPPMSVLRQCLTGPGLAVGRVARNPGRHVIPEGAGSGQGGWLSVLGCSRLAAGVCVCRWRGQGGAPGGGSRPGGRRAEDVRP